jgi:hypothetical protein
MEVEQTIAHVAQFVGPLDQYYTLPFIEGACSRDQSPQSFPGLQPFARKVLHGLVLTATELRNDFLKYYFEKGTPAVPSSYIRFVEDIQILCVPYKAVQRKGLVETLTCHPERYEYPSDKQVTSLTSNRDRPSLFEVEIQLGKNNGAHPYYTFTVFPLLYSRYYHSENCTTLTFLNNVSPSEAEASLREKSDLSPEKIRIILEHAVYQPSFVEISDGKNALEMALIDGQILCTLRLGTTSLSRLLPLQFLPSQQSHNGNTSLQFASFAYELLNHVKNPCNGDK